MEHRIFDKAVPLLGRWPHRFGWLLFRHSLDTTLLWIQGV